MYLWGITDLYRNYIPPRYISNENLITFVLLRGAYVNLHM